MSDSASTINLEADGDCFPSLALLREAHSKLLKRHREQGNHPEILAEIEQLVLKGQATGALLDNEADRWAAQGLLDYWGSLLYRAGQEPPDATLAEFDPTLAPDLNDDLCPYIGLEAFQEANQNLFFGRQRLVDKLLKHLENHRLLIVVGSSGSGKSSLVLGGVLPRLIAGALPSSQDWVYYAPLVPGSDPFAALARRLKPAQVTATEWIPQQVSAFRQNSSHLTQLVQQADHQPVVLVVDQFEEVFTLCRDQEVRQMLIKNLLNFIQAPGVQNILILTMRTDFESQFVRTPDLQALFEQSHLRVTALDANELRETIERPAELVGLKFEEGLVDALLNDVLGEPAALPLLQFTLLKLWSNREHNRVTWEAYRRLGGGRQALEISADEFYNALIPEEQLTVKRILLRMVRPTEGLEITSNRILRKELYLSGEARDRIDRVLDKLVQAHLIRLTEGDTSDDAQIEIAHEALIRNWFRLIGWLEDERGSLRQRIRLTDAAEQWEAKGRDSSILLRGNLLKEFQSYPDLNELETRFIQSSKRAERRNQFILTIGNVGIALGILALVGYGISAYESNTRDIAQRAVDSLEGQLDELKNQRDETSLAMKRADMSRQQAEANQVKAKAELQAIQSQLTKERQKLKEQFLTTQQEKAQISAQLEAIQQNIEETRKQLLNAQQRNAQASVDLERINAQIETLQRLQVTRAEYSPNGNFIATVGRDGTAQLWNAQTSEKIAELGDEQRDDLNKILSVAFSLDSKFVATASTNGSAQIWERRESQWRMVRVLQGHTREVTSISFSPRDPNLMVTGSLDKSFIIWDVNSGRELYHQTFQEEVTSFAISEDGRYVVGVTVDGRIAQIDLYRPPDNDISKLTLHQRALSTIDR